MKKGRWYVRHVCIRCNKELSKTERIYSDGVCPLCGNVSKGTICDTEKTSYMEDK